MSRENALLVRQARFIPFVLILSRTRAARHDQVVTMLNRFRLAAPQDGAATLSCDEQAMEIVMAVTGKPRFLLLDAPTGGMSLAGKRTKGELLRPLQAHRKGMLRNPRPLLLD